MTLLTTPTNLSKAPPLGVSNYSHRPQLVGVCLRIEPAGVSTSSYRVFIDSSMVSSNAVMDCWSCPVPATACLVTPLVCPHTEAAPFYAVRSCLSSATTGNGLHEPFHIVRGLSISPHLDKRP